MGADVPLFIGGHPALFGQDSSTGERRAVLVDPSGHILTSAGTAGDPGVVQVADKTDTSKLLVVDSAGRITVLMPTGVNANQVQGTAADGAAAVGNPQQIGGVDGSGNAQSLKVGTDGRIEAERATSGAKTNVASSASSVTVLAANANRKGGCLYNDSNQILYLDLTGGTASATSYSVQIPANGFFVITDVPLITQAITGIWAAANGNARVTEFS